jgi:molybdopterin converting factor small subunit
MGYSLIAEVKIKLFANLREAAGTSEQLLSEEKIIDILYLSLSSILIKKSYIRKTRRNLP